VEAENIPVLSPTHLVSTGKQKTAAVYVSAGAKCGFTVIWVLRSASWFFTLGRRIMEQRRSHLSFGVFSCIGFYLCRRDLCDHALALNSGTRLAPV